MKPSVSPGSRQGRSGMRPQSTTPSRIFGVSWPNCPSLPTRDALNPVSLMPLPIFPSKIQCTAFGNSPAPPCPPSHDHRVETLAGHFSVQCDAPHKAPGRRGNPGGNLPQSGRTAPVRVPSPETANASFAAGLQVRVASNSGRPGQRRREGSVPEPEAGRPVT